MSCVLPKIHKGLYHLPGRPVVSHSGIHTERISQMVDHYINPIVPQTKSIVRDSTRKIKILKEIQNLSSNMILCTLDVFSL